MIQPLSLNFSNTFSISLIEYLCPKSLKIVSTLNYASNYLQYLVISYSPFAFFELLLLAPLVFDGELEDMTI